MAITTVLFDGDGVLQYPPLGWPQHILELTGAPDWRAIDEIEHALMAGGDPAPAFEVGFPRRTVGVEAILDAWNDTVVDAEALALLDALRAGGVRCFLASNQQERRAAWMRGGPLADHLDGLFFSCELGRAKPSGDFFRAILERLDADPAATLFIDDLTGNVEAARSAGLHAEHKSRAVGHRRLVEIARHYDLLPR